MIRSQPSWLANGTLAPEEMPAELRADAFVLSAAHLPATEGELSGMAAFVQQFPAAVTAFNTPRRSSMFASRLARRTAAVVAMILLAAGTAAASAAGVVSSPFSSGRSEVAAATGPDDTVADETVEDDQNQIDDGDGNDEADDNVDADVADDGGNHGGDDHGGNDHGGNDD